MLSLLNLFKQKNQFKKDLRQASPEQQGGFL
jgi:hypothetical protein